MTRAEFCRRHGLDYGRFGAWSKQYGEALPGFVEVAMDGPADDLQKGSPCGKGEAMAEIVSPSGWLLRLPANYGADCASELLKIIAKC